MALGCLVVICVALGASFLKVDLQEDFDEDPRLRGPIILKVIPASWPPVTDMPEQTWDWTAEDLGLGTAMLQDIWTWDCRTSGLDIALFSSQPGGPKGPADSSLFICMFLVGVAVPALHAFHMPSTLNSNNPSVYLADKYGYLRCQISMDRYLGTYNQGQYLTSHNRD